VIRVGAVNEKRGLRRVVAGEDGPQFDTVQTDRTPVIIVTTPTGHHHFGASRYDCFPFGRLRSFPLIGGSCRLLSVGTIAAMSWLVQSIQ
jgi:hypothetical protein